MNKQFSQLHTRGAAMMIFMMFFLVASVALTYSISRSLYAELAGFRLLYDSKQSYLMAEAGVEDMAYRFIAAMTPDSTEVITIGDSVATSTHVLDSADDSYTITSEAIDNGAYRSSLVVLYMGAGASFNFGVQTGNGGFEMSNGSSVTGNVFSNGTIDGGGSSEIFGDAISAGPSGLIDGAEVHGSAWAHIVRDSVIDGDVFAYTLDDGEVGGDADVWEILNSPSVYGTTTTGLIVGDEDPVDLPISDEDIDAIKQDILDNGTVIASTSPECLDGEYDLTSTSTTLGFVKIECDYTLTKGSGSTLTLTGPVWVEGNISFKKPDVVIDGSVGNRTVPVIADNENNRSTSSRMLVEVGTSFTGSGDPKSYVMLISQNSDAENGEVENVDAITLQQSSAGDLLVYASHGRITMANSVALNEVTAYKISLGNSANVTYESGLVNLLFTTGPGGGFTIGEWLEIE